jgi:flagellar protein FliO/FliZ
MLAQQIWSVLIFLACLAALPFLVKRWKSVNNAKFGGGVEPAPRVISVLAVGPQQRIVTVEVGREGARQRMVLGVTSQNISCLFAESLSEQMQAPKADTIETSATTA